MHPKIQRRIEDQIALIEHGADHADVFREHTDHPFIAAQLERIEREENLPRHLAIEVLVQGHRHVSKIRLEQLKAVLNAGNSEEHRE